MKAQSRAKLVALYDRIILAGREVGMMPPQDMIWNVDRARNVARGVFLCCGDIQGLRRGAPFSVAACSVSWGIRAPSLARHRS